MTTWEFGGFAPVFIGPDQSPYSILQTFNGTILDVAPLFTLDFGTKSYSHQSPSLAGTGMAFASGKYTAAGAAVPGTYAMTVRCSGSDSPPSYTDYSLNVVVNATGLGNPPVFAGPIDDQITSGDFTFDVSAFFTGASSYSVGALPPGLAFNTSSGLFTGTSATLGTGLFGPFTVNGINAGGSTPTNPFSITALIPDTGPSDFSDVTLQALLDPQNNGTGILIVRRHDPTDTSRVCYYVRCRQHNHGISKWVECLATDDSTARANKIILAIALPNQPIWPLAT